MTPKTVSNPRIHVDHLRGNGGSRAYLVVNVDWIKAGLLASCPMSEAELYALAENALHIAGILRRNAE
jgi:hypothetical protein